MTRRGATRAWMLAAAALAAIGTALVLWVVPAFSGGTAGQWTWVSGAIFHDNAPDPGTAVLTAYNASSEPQQASVRGINPNGSTVNPNGSTSFTIQPGQTHVSAFDCSSGVGCTRTYELTTPSDDVVVSLVFDEIETTGLTYSGLIPPSGFTVFGPDQETADMNVQAIDAATAELAPEVAALQTDNAQLRADTAALRRDTKKLRKQLKKVLKAVR